MKEIEKAKRLGTEDRHRTEEAIAAAFQPMVNEISEHLIESYMMKPYHIEMIRDGDTWFAHVRELSGCMTEGDTIEEAGTMILDAMRGWLEVTLAFGAEIPLPEKD